MPLEIAVLVLDVVALYFAIGAGVALLFILFGVGRVDPVAKASPLRFKVLIVPGVIALWPVVLVLWLRGHKEAKA